MKKNEMILLPLHSNTQSTVSVPIMCVCVYSCTHMHSHVYKYARVCMCVCFPHSREVQLGRAELQEVMLVIHQDVSCLT